MIGGLGWQELLIVLVIVALIFGASRVADLGGALGRGIREFRQEAARPEEESEDDDEEMASASSDSSDDDSEKESSG
ncbi:MAG: twin-arginine translocase TatA/TatE family subunit [Chloroflexi bacterium]|nr:twin-arginine translocase TatA/TatE family subunit [Chloroflexota bacterium]